MRHEASATSITWIPSEAIRGINRLPFDGGVAHYDEPPPERIEGPDHLHRLRDDDRFRFANVLSGWTEVRDGRIVDFGCEGTGLIGSTTLGVGGQEATFAATAFPDTLGDVETGDRWVRFRHTAGGRTGVPMPRRVNRPPFVQFHAPTAWTTVELTMHADGHHEVSFADASVFPRHWLYGGDGTLAAKSGTIDFRRWARQSFAKRTPWGDLDAARDLGRVTTGDVESELERALSAQIMAGKVRISKVREGRRLLTQGEPGTDVLLLLDGVVAVDVDGEVLAELGPGAVLGERAGIGDGLRTSTVTAVTRCRVAVADSGAVMDDALVSLAQEHRREERDLHHIGDKP
ncbi:MAG: cyclic nucleotide-binding domain-containing protein [Microthrixaceae bacterium]